MNVYECHVKNIFTRKMKDENVPFNGGRTVLRGYRALERNEQNVNYTG